jgi:hypothetical protein
MKMHMEDGLPDQAFSVVRVRVRVRVAVRVVVAFSGVT